ncbi:MAG: NAD(P)/FAD-dependent oxidoreductase, partial [Candidatus Omnitrophica bacterium]|nr:NAD(P)/FAD-dependent oxidoreductase [Candidatus Omnitrophota bacterium]
MEQVDITIIGAGVIGLAVAARLSKSGQNILVVEKNPSFGQETSSRNSEVIHAGIYYPKDSLKAKTCLEGKELLYIFCTQNKIPHKKIGKLIVATKKEEIPDLQGLLENGLASGVTDLKILSQKETKSLEPNIDCLQAIYSPSTGILDTHSFMKALLFQFESQAGMIAYNTQVTAIGKVKDGFEIFVQDTREGNFEFFSRFVINCAGLNSDQVAAMSGIVKDEYKI